MENLLFSGVPILKHIRVLIYLNLDNDWDLCDVAQDEKLIVIHSLFLSETAFAFAN